MEVKTTISKLSPVFNSFVTFTDSLGGRERIARLIGYFSTFILPFIENNPKFKSIIKVLSGLSKQMGIFKQILNLFCELSTFKSLLNRIKEANKLDINFILKIVGDLAIILLLVCDHISLLQNIGSVEFTPKTLDLCNQIILVCWALYIVCNAFYNLLDINILKKTKLSLKSEKDSIEKTTNINDIKLDIKSKYLDMTINLLELPLAIHYITGNDKLVPGWIGGMFATLSGALAVYQIWN